METKLHPNYAQNSDAKLAEEILTRCVHCGFCNATCPTYQLIGDENDGPRGRIYQIKNMLETGEANEHARHHLDRCLLCRSCETTCPSGVPYSQLYDLGQHILNEELERSSTDKLKRSALRTVLVSKPLLNTALATGEKVKSLLPEKLRKKLPYRSKAIPTNTSTHKRKVILFSGCVQNSVSPDIDSSTINILDKLSIETVQIKQTKCCGALSQHTGQESVAIGQMKRNIDLLWPTISEGVEAIVSNASGCGVMLKEYKHHLRNDEEYVRKAELISSITKDISEIVMNEDCSVLKRNVPRTVAWHAPCTLQHGQKITGQVEQILQKQGYMLVPVADSHLCCGSAGSYSIFQPEISEQLKSNKLQHLQNNAPEIIATANIGCQMHLQSGTDIPVVHWITLLDNQNETLNDKNLRLRLPKLE